MALAEGCRELPADLERGVRDQPRDDGRDVGSGRIAKRGPAQGMARRRLTQAEELDRAFGRLDPDAARSGRRHDSPDVGPADPAPGQALVEQGEGHTSPEVQELADAGTRAGLELDKLDGLVVGELDQAIGKPLAEPPVAKTARERAEPGSEPLEDPTLGALPRSELDECGVVVVDDRRDVPVRGLPGRTSTDGDAEPARPEGHRRGRGDTARLTSLAAEDRWVAGAHRSLRRVVGGVMAPS